MAARMPQYDTVADYVAAQAEPGQRAWTALDAVVRGLEPEVETRFSYGIPTYFIAGKRLVHTAIWAAHLAMYPVPPAPPDDPDLVGDLEAVRHGKGTLHFPYAGGFDPTLPERVVQAHRHRLGRV